MHKNRSRICRHCVISLHLLPLPLFSISALLFFSPSFSFFLHSPSFHILSRFCSSLTSSPSSFWSSFLCFRLSEPRC
ncbi:hypothetical protein Csa_000687 [Cucumis sativus]|uniref:Uncharacterized protein n=1 Tax=Cucumis sativus TaxID=3659 RepID=A0A0A0KMZ6_CUCSA|nr:hypothetical protein Csa_000687 [Cucumis sativus]